jgi:hypothetical protein
MRLFCGAGASMQLRILPRNYLRMLVYAVGLLGGYLQKFSNFQLTDERQHRCELRGQ